jgi:SAM-dependent methyltransferase
MTKATPRSGKTAHWDDAYRSKTPERQSWYQAEPERSLAMMANAGVAPGDPVIDVGGGASLLADRLLARGHTDLTVLDISSAALLASRQRLGAAADQVEWLCADIRTFQPSRQFALWHDRALFHFLTDRNDRAAYLAALDAGLRIGGQLVLATFAVGGPRRCSGLDIVQYDADKLAGLLGPSLELQEQAREEHRTPQGGSQLFAWFRFRKS